MKERDTISGQELKNWPSFYFFLVSFFFFLLLLFQNDLVFSDLKTKLWKKKKKKKKNYNDNLKIEIRNLKPFKQDW